MHLKVTPKTCLANNKSWRPNCVLSSATRKKNTNRIFNVNDKAFDGFNSSAKIRYKGKNKWKNKKATSTKMHQKGHLMEEVHVACITAQICTPDT